MRQLTGLLEVINKAHLVDFYNSILSYGSVHGAKLPSLNEFLVTSLGESEETVSQFDNNTDKILEREAFKRLQERRDSLGK